MTPGDPASHRRLRRLTLAIVVLNAFLAAIRTATYQQFFAMPGSSRFIVELVIVLAIYFAGIFWITSTDDAERGAALSVGTTFGLVTAALLIIHFAQENLITLPPGRATELFALFFIFAALVLWGTAGYATARRGAPVSAGATAGLRAAVVCMLVLVAGGLLLTFFSIPSPNYVLTWEEYQASGWSDAHAFGIANTFHSAFMHMIVGPILGGIVGALGWAIGRAIPRSAPLGTGSN